MVEHSLFLDYLENREVRGKNYVWDAVLLQHFTHQ